MRDNSSDILDDSNRGGLFPSECPLLSEIWRESMVGIALVSEDGKFLFVNPAFCDIVEYSEPELQTRTFQSITHPDDVGADTVMANQVHDDAREKYYMIKRYITKRGHVVTVKLFVNPVKKDDKFVFFLSQIIELEGAKEEEAPREPTTKIPGSWKAWAALGAYIATEMIINIKEHW